MKFLLFLFVQFTILGQSGMAYDVSPENPYGKLNPEAPKETGDFGPMIGTNDCISTIRNPDQTWATPEKMTWSFKYILNGTAVQDGSVRGDSKTNVNIRQFIADSSKWYVHFYSGSTPDSQLPTWEGRKRGDSIVLYNEQQAPNGMDGFYRITFSNITENSFKWLGEWVDTAESFSYPTWKIDCRKRSTKPSDQEIILENIKAFSQAYMNKDPQGIANFYTADAKLFPGNSPIISGRTEIKKRWDFVEGLTEPFHKITPSEIKIIDNYAYDYGYYEGNSRSKDGKENPFSGKYVVVWKKVGDDWKIYLDIWNRI